MDATAGDNGLTIVFAPSGRNGTGTLTARLAGEVLHVEQANPAKSKARADFTKAVCANRDGIDPADVEAELLKLAGELASRPDGEAPPDWNTLPEVDVSRIIRPERAITPEVSTVAIPSMTSLGDGMAGRWQFYLRWSDGKRERRGLGATIELPNGSQVVIKDGRK